MAQPKPIASLTSGLLARKGAAQPAMRRPVLGFVRSPIQDDLGWNDMGFDIEPDHAAVEDAAAPIGLTPMEAVVPLPTVVIERELLARRLSIKVASNGRKAAFTLRMDSERHLKLRLACAITGRSAQQIVTQAIDEFFNDLPEIDRLTEQLPPERDGERMKGG